MTRYNQCSEDSMLAQVIQGYLTLARQGLWRHSPRM